MRKYNINADLVRVIEHLYDNAIGAVQINGCTGETFITPVGVRQGCPLHLHVSTSSRKDYV